MRFLKENFLKKGNETNERNDHIFIFTTLKKRKISLANMHTENVIEYENVNGDGKLK